MPTILNPWVILGAALMLGVVAWQAYDFGVDRCEGKHAQAALAQAEQARKKEKAAQTAVNDASAKAETAIEKIRIVTRTIIQKVPVHVTPEIDRRYPLPLGFVRVLDASALGVDVSAISIAPGKPDDAPGPVTASGAATVIAGNYGSCRETAERLTGLQQAWRDALAAVGEAPH